MSQPDSSDPSRLDHLLGPVLKSASGRTAWSRVSSVVMRGLSEGIPPEDMRLWIGINAVEGSIQPVPSGADGFRRGPGAERTDPAEGSTRGMAERMRSLAEGRKWGPLVDAARKRASSSSDGDGAAFRRDRLLRGKALLAGLLLELPGGTGGLPRNATMRSALAVIGKMWLEDEAGYDSVILTQELLALELGCTAKTAWRVLSDLVDAGLVSRPRSGRWIAGRYRIVRLRSRPRIRAMASRKDDIRELVDGERSALSSLILSVDHPAWSHSSVLSHHHWLMLLADVAGIAPEVFGIRPKMARRLRAELTARYALTAGTVEPFLTEVLDRLADDPECGVDGETARARKVRAASEYEERIARRREEREEVRAAKEEMYAVLDELLKEYPVPASPFLAFEDTATEREEAFLEWVDEVHGEVIAGDPDRELRRRLTAALGSRLEHSGYPAEFASGTASFLMEADADSSLEEWLAAA